MPIGYAQPTPAFTASVIVPVGAADDQLARQVVAVLAQQAPFDFEVVLSLNSAAAVDRSAVDEIVRATSDARLRVVPSADRRGAAHARNVAALTSRAPMLAFCDADDEVHAGWLAALARGLGSWDAVTGHIHEVAPPGQQGWRPPATPGRLPTFLGVPYILSGNLAITRASFLAVGGFDETLSRCEDIAFGWTLLNKGFRIGYVEEAVLDYRHRSGLRALMHQHYLYGRGMAEVVSRYRLPSIGNPQRLRGLALLRPNAQPAPRSVPGFLRRASLAVGRVVGLFAERRRANAKSDEPAG
jgi:GT2 family glycosyltransferase